VAIDLAAHLSDETRVAREPIAARGLVVESSFTSLADVAKALTAPWLPVQLLLTQSFDSTHKIARVRMPVLIAHGVADRGVVVPAQAGTQCFCRFEGRWIPACAGMTNYALAPRGRNAPSHLARAGSFAGSLVHTLAICARICASACACARSRPQALSLAPMRCSPRRLRS
jgi:hypothetical protein